MLEFKTFHASSTELEPKLNELGAQGWDLAGFENIQGDFYRVVMRRHIAKPTNPLIGA